MSDAPKLKKGLERALYSPGYRLPDLAVDFIRYEGSAGKRGAHGEPLEPDEAPSVEVIAVWLAGHDIAQVLSDEVLARVEREVNPWGVSA
jgi:hypothetical protein